MKSSIFKAIVLVLILMFIFPPGFAGAYDYAAYKQAVTAIDNAADRIRMADGAVSQVLMEAMSGKHGELHKWSLIDGKMTELGATIEASISEIGSNASVVFSSNPSYQLPSVKLGNPFGGNLKYARNKKTELLELAKKESDKKSQLNAMIAKVDKQLLNATKGFMGDAVEGFIPTEVQLGGEGAVLVLGAYWGPPGLVVAGLAVFASFTFNTVVSTYYNATSLADQIKSLNDMKQMLEANRRTAEQNFSVLKTGAQEMNEIEQVLVKQQKELDTYREKITRAQEGWNNLAQGAFKAKQAETVAQAKRLSAADKKPIKVGGWLYGMSPIPPIQPGEYSGDIDSIVADLDSYSKAVEDGGDPDNFYDLASNWDKATTDKYLPLRKEYDKKYADYRAAAIVCWQKLALVNKQYGAAWRRIKNPTYEEYVALLARWQAAREAVYAGLRPYGRAMINPYRELVKLDRVRRGGETAFSIFRCRVEDAVTYRSRDFWKKLYQHVSFLEDAVSETGFALSGIPYYPKGIKERAENIDAEIAHEFEWGRDVTTVKESLLSTAAQLKKTGVNVKEGAKAYDAAMLDVRRILNQGRLEMETYLTQYGKLVNHPRVNRYSMGWMWMDRPSDPFVPNTTETNERVKSLSKYIKENLNYSEPSYLEEAKKIDWEGLARIYEEKANELNFYIDWAEKYRNKRDAVVSRLGKIRRTVRGVGDGFYVIEMPAVDTIVKEFSEPQWAAITGEVEKYVSESSFKQLSWARWQQQQWGKILPWQKLYAAQTILLNRINEEMKEYVQARRNGWFRRVSEEIIKPIEEDWKGLRALCERYDALATPIRNQIGNAPEEAEKEMMSVWDIWNRMPQFSKNMITSEHNHFRRAADWLKDYIRFKVDGVKPSLQPPYNSVAVQIDDLIGSYRPELAKWQKQQREAEAASEKRQREWEAEQARIKAEQERSRQEEQAKQEKANSRISAIAGMYENFRQAYESRDDSRIAGFMDDDWEAGDGTTLFDLQDNLARTFRIFDEIKYNIQNLKIGLKSEGTYTVNYDVTITSRIYNRNIKHEEKSSVNEEVMFDDSGKLKIIRTINGRFWYVE